ncbi:serine/threonine-protein kinase [Streptomyces roseolus]
MSGGGSARWRVGEVVDGRYEVTALLGRGGMGEVFRVRHLGWGTDLAVKSPLLGDADSPRRRELFTAEAQTWVSLGLHPHVCGCHYVRTIGGVPRVFAEYVPGGSLADRIRSRQLYAGGEADVLARILDVAVQTAWGLEHAHRRGVVHQDVKPANVLLDDSGTAKITDFGLARAHAAALTGSAEVRPGASLLLTGGGMTPAYAAPEQAAGHRVGARSDLFSFGVSVLEMLTGEVRWLLGPLAEGVLETCRAEGSAGEGLPPIPPGCWPAACARTPPTGPPRWPRWRSSSPPCTAACSAAPTRGPSPGPPTSSPPSTGTGRRPCWTSATRRVPPRSPPPWRPTRSTWPPGTTPACWTGGGAGSPTRPCSPTWRRPARPARTTPDRHC